MQIVVIAVPSTLQQSFISLGNIVIQSIINGFGAPVMAGYSAAVKLNNLVITSFTTLGMVFPTTQHRTWAQEKCHVSKKASVPVLKWYGC